MRDREFPRELAQHLRLTARGEWDPERRRGLLKLADAYEHMAAALAERHSEER